MPLGNLTKQLAQQALQANVSDMLDSLRPKDAAQVAESLQGSRQAAVPGENVCAIILGQIQAMQKALKEDEELLVLVQSGLETVRVMEIFVPSWGVAVLSGIDPERNLTRVIMPTDRVQLTCKVLKVQAGARPVKVAVVAPKPPA